MFKIEIYYIEKQFFFKKKYYLDIHFQKSVKFKENEDLVYYYIHINGDFKELGKKLFSLKLSSEEQNINNQTSFILKKNKVIIEDLNFIEFNSDIKEEQGIEDGEFEEFDFDYSKIIISLDEWNSALENFKIEYKDKYKELFKKEPDFI